MKVKLFDNRVVKLYSVYASAIATIVSTIFIFIDLCPLIKYIVGIFTLIILIVIYIIIWVYYNRLQETTINIDNSTVVIKAGDIFKEKGFKVIAFNEFFDTIVDNNIIANNSLNGIFIKQNIEDIEALNNHIKNEIDDDDIVDSKVIRKRGGKNIKYKLSTVVIWNNEYLLTAFSKFDDTNRANLTMPEYIEFLINFWDRVNKVYAQENVSVPILGSGITRIKEHKNITDEDLLKIMLWTFKLSEYRCKYPAKLSIIIHEAKLKTINLLDIRSFEKGL